jgi:hypothetical protein
MSPSLPIPAPVSLTPTNVTQFTPRHLNAQKAMANWEKKSSYLLREIVKFRTYIDCLQAAEVGKQKIYAERAARKAEFGKEEGDSTLKLESTPRA